MKAHTAVNLLTGLVVTCTYCSLPAPFVQQRTLTYQVPEQNEALGLLVIWHLKSVAFIRLTLKPKHTQCFSNICLQRIFCLNSILPLSGVSNPATGCIFYRNGLIHHRDETPPPRQTIQLKISTRSVFFFWGGGPQKLLPDECCQSAPSDVASRSATSSLCDNKCAKGREQRQRWTLWNQSARKISQV